MSRKSSLWYKLIALFLALAVVAPMLAACPGGASAPSSHCSISPSGTVLPRQGQQIFTITPDTCYEIADVKVNGASVGPRSALTFNNVTTKQTITCSCQKATHTITVLPNVNGGITPFGATVNACEDSPVFAIIPNHCFDVNNVTVDNVSIGAKSYYQFTHVTADHTISASFSQRRQWMLATAGPHGSISPAGTVTQKLWVPCGQNSPVFTFNPDDGYEVAEVRMDGITSTGPFQFFNVEEDDHTIFVTFEVRPTHTITATADPDGEISDPGTTTILNHDNKEYTITPDPGYKVADVKVDGESQGAVGTYTFTAVTADHMILASFSKQVTHDIWVKTGPGGWIARVPCSENATSIYENSGQPFPIITVDEHSDVCFIIIAEEPCCQIANVYVDGFPYGPINEYTFKDVTADHTIEAVFQCD
jgi:hypothetical protein